MNMPRHANDQHDHRDRFCPAIYVRAPEQTTNTKIATTMDGSGPFSTIPNAEMQSTGHEPGWHFHSSPEIASIRLKFAVHPGNFG